MEPNYKLDEYSKHAYSAIATIFEMIAAGAKGEYGMYRRTNSKEELDPDTHYQFQAGIQTKPCNVLLDFAVKKDGIARIHIEVTRGESGGNYTSSFSIKDFKKELMVVEFFLKRNFL
ncbi:MAG TPA: hypothetical protein PKI61_03315 [bacterium]|nr:hypothetical protein [bacterium]HPT29560.1 hypothetical protein [bacterium]